MSVVDLMLRDLRDVVGEGPYGWLLIALVLGQPVVAWRLARRGSRLAYVALLAPVGMLGAWYLYYVTGWWTITPGDSRPIVVPALAAWVLVAAAWLLMDEPG